MAALIARICEVFPLLCPVCGGPIRIIAFITHSADVGKYSCPSGWTQSHRTSPPARGPPRWDDGDAQMDVGVQVQPDWDLAAQLAPDFEVLQRVNW